MSSVNRASITDLNDIARNDFDVSVVRNNCEDNHLNSDSRLNNSNILRDPLTPHNFNKAESVLIAKKSMILIILLTMNKANSMIKLRIK
jgi:hypothetical protein